MASEPLCGSKSLIQTQLQRPASPPRPLAGLSFDPRKDLDVLKPRPDEDGMVAARSAGFTPLTTRNESAIQIARGLNSSLQKQDGEIGQLDNRSNGWKL